MGEDEMKLNNLWRSRLAQILIGTAIVIALVLVVRGTHAQSGPVHMATDWSHRHLIFSQPHSLMDGFKLSANPRYVQQWIRRNAEKKRGGNAERGNQPQTNAIRGDWNVYLGNLGTVGAGNYPAKFSFDITAASCTAPQPDFVVYNTSLAGSDTAVAAEDTGAFTGRAGLGSTISITNGGNTLVMTATGAAPTNTGPGAGTFNRAGAAANAQTRANDLAAGINFAGNGSFVGVAAAAAGGVLTVTSTLGGTAGNSITVASDPASNFAWTFSNFVDGASGVPTVVALDNLYSGCSGTVPSPYWAYNTGTGATAATSVVLSADGSQVAFVQNVGAGGVGAQLVLLKWAAGTSSVNTPQDLTGPTTNVINGSYRGCTAPCMTTINFSGGTADTDTNSSPFYDYTPGDDTLYVGDDNGSLHKFTGVFSGTPGEIISTGADVWPAVVNAGNVLTSPVYDSGVGKIFVADAVRTLHSVDQTIGSGAGGIVTTAALGTLGITASPTVDASIGNVYVFVEADTTGGANKRAAVCQFSTSFAAGARCTGATGNQAVVATSNTAPVTALNAGDFDNIYYSSANGTGNLYVCGTSGAAGAATTTPTIWQIPITAGVMGTPVQGPSLTTANAECSPMTEFMNGTTDRLFVSVAAIGQTAAPIGCPSNTGCIMSFDITNPATWGLTTATSATAAVAGGASGVIIDSSSGPAGSSQIYFTPLAAGNCTTASGQGIGGCATQASQAAIQ
jgi:hypothetical protein